MLTSIFWLIAGLVLILLGANYLTDGSSSLARRMGISDLIVGLTVVAFGTSTPELVISIIAALNGNAPIAVGNVVGSNIFNILMIIGVTAMVRPIMMEKTVMIRQMPIMVLSSFVLLFLGNSGWLNVKGIDEITRTEGIFLLIFFFLFMRYTISDAKGVIGSHQGVEKSEAKIQPSKELPLWKVAVYILGGLGGLIFGGDKFVDGATVVARSLGMSDALIGLTIVAAGTSLPELATSIVAAIKGRPGIAVGNVIGSNIFNVTLVLGAASVITPLQFGSIGNFDLLTLMAASGLFLLFGWFFKERTITRWEGAVMVGCYIAYTAWLISGVAE